MESKQRQRNDVDLWPHTGVRAQIYTHARAHTHATKKYIQSSQGETAIFAHVSTTAQGGTAGEPPPHFLTTVTNNGKDMGQDGQGSLSVLVGIST